MDLLSTNAGSHLLRKEGVLRIVGECIPVEWPEITDRLCDSSICFSSCPERDHINIIALKIASILSRVDLREIQVVTVDGSPHCLHLHHAAEEALRITGKCVEVRHMVVYKGKLFQVSQNAVKIARFLHKVDALISKFSNDR